MGNPANKEELLEAQARLKKEILRRQSQLELQPNLIMEEMDVLDFAATCAICLLICSKIIDESADAWQDNKKEGKAIARDLAEVPSFLAEELISLRAKLIAEGYEGYNLEKI